MDLLSYALVTLADTKQFLGIDNNEQDDTIKLLINMATDYIEKKTNRRFKSTVYTDEEYDGTGKFELKLKQFPVITFTQLQKNNATDNTDSWETINATDYWVDLETGIITRTSEFLDWEDNEEVGLAESVFSLGKNKYRITYTVGYATIPSDLQYACMAFVSQVLNNRKAGGIKSESLGDHSIVFEEIYQKDSIVKQILDNYKDINI